MAIAVVTLLIILTITYHARVAVINHVAKQQLSLVQVKITCLNFSLTSNMTVVVDKLCLQSPKADIEIVDMAVQWQYSPQFKITYIDVKHAQIKGTEHLFSSINDIPKSNEHSSNNQNIRQLLQASLTSYIKQISQFQLPMNINIAELSYLPFTVKNNAKTSREPAQNQQKMPYIASLSAVNNSLSVSLKDADKIEFIKAKLSKNIDNFSIALSTKLNPLKSFANAHQLPITAELQHSLDVNEVSGSVDTLITYQADLLSMQNKITDLTIASEQGIGRSGAFKLKAALNFKSQLQLMANNTVNKTNNTKSATTDKSNSEIALTFARKNEVSLQYSQAHLFTMLTENKVSPAIISILKDNPLPQLSLKLQDKATLNLNDNKVNLSSLEITAGGDERVHQVNLNNISVTLPDSSIAVSNVNDRKAEKSANQTSHAIVVEGFTIDSQVKLADLEKFTTAPIYLHLAGSLKKTAKHTELKLTENSSITTKNIVLAKQQSTGKQISLAKHSKASATSKAKALLTLKTLSVSLEGSLQLFADNAVNINLKAHSQATRVNIPKTLQLNSFDIFSDINGNLDDIRINASSRADGVNLGSIIITGPAVSPKVQFAATNLQLTDLLSLNIQLPVKIELIDGLLDYRVSGQLTDLSTIENTPFSAAVAVTSVTGEVDGIWLQELSWQQRFSLLAGTITTSPNTSENLTVELIETATPLSKLSMNTNWTFNKSFKLYASKLKANVLGGSFSIAKIQWPFEPGHSADVQLHSIDLEQVLALDKKQGIVVTGNISGQLPVTFDGEKYIIEDGELHNINNGLIQVIDNPAVAQLKASNSQLQLAFDALQNLHYHQLSSAVSMGGDGYMLLDTVIKGRNPDIDNDVNLNLNLNYDLLGLLESLSITQRFEEKIIKGLQKNKE